MSGGMRQRIVGAIALSCQPKVLIADEPTTSLDVTIQAQYLRLLKEIQKETGVSIIFITHDFGVVAKMCDRVAVMYAGKIVESADVRELFSQPRHPYTVALLGSLPKMETRVERLSSVEGQPPSLIDLPPGCSFAPRCSQVTEKCKEGESPPQVMFGSNHYVSCWMAAG
jgi:oligopeptide/dipeptide ABC transporter ATP-binding protein